MLFKLHAKLFALTLSLWIFSQLSGCAALFVAGGATGYSLATDPRTSGEIWDDNSLEISAYNALAKIPDFDANEQSHINITVYNGVLLITGEVIAKEMSERAEEILSSLQGPRLVINRLAIQAPSSFAQRTKDTFLLASLKANFAFTEGISAMEIKTVVEREVVYLMGKLTQEEATKATEAASQVAGVAKVVKIFDYVN